MKHIYFTGVILLTFTSSFAQFNYGVKGGLNLSNLRFRNDIGEWKPAVHAGAWVSYDIIKRLTIANDLLYSEKGFSSSGGYKAHFSYISFLTNIRYNAIRKLSVEVGGGPGYLVSSYVKSDGNNPENRWDNKIDWEICAGVYYMLNSKIALTLRYEHGLSNVVSKYAAPDYPPIKGVDYYVDYLKATYRELAVKDTNRNFQLSINYAFGHKQ
jgi:hypothetical protein